MGCEQSRQFNSNLRLRAKKGRKPLNKILRKSSVDFEYQMRAQGNQTNDGCSTNLTNTQMFNNTISSRRRTPLLVPELNLPSYSYLKKKIGIRNDDYTRLKKKMKELQQFDYGTFDAEIIMTECEQNLKGTQMYYIGQFKKDTQVKNGAGMCIWGNGESYEGFLVNNQSHGRGRHIYQNGEVYDGEYFDGKKHGMGTMIFTDGSKYTGEWYKGYKHGEGITYYRDGTSEEQAWIFNCLRTSTK